MYYNESDEEQAERLGNSVNNVIDKILEKEVSYNGVCLEVFIVRVLFHLIKIYMRGWGIDPRKDIYASIARKLRNNKNKDYGKAK